jgi:hypothetical protein
VWREATALSYNFAIEGRILMLSSVVCRYEHWSEDWFKAWSKRLDYPSDGQIHRRIWEFCAIGQALEERGMLRPGKSGICFAAGRKFLPSAFAAFGCDILATDRAVTGPWEGQHAASRSDLFYERIVTREEFDKHVTFRHLDMTDLRSIEPEKYDFLWSSCAFEHLGSLRAGFDFVTNALKLLRRGGIAVHTTEFNLSSNISETVGRLCHLPPPRYRKARPSSETAWVRIGAGRF